MDLRSLAEIEGSTQRLAAFLETWYLLSPGDTATTDPKLMVDFLREASEAQQLMGTYCSLLAPRPIALPDGTRLTGFMGEQGLFAWAYEATDTPDPIVWTSRSDRRGGRYVPTRQRLGSFLLSAVLMEAIEWAKFGCLPLGNPPWKRLVDDGTARRAAPPWFWDEEDVIPGYSGFHLLFASEAVLFCNPHLELAGALSRDGMKRSGIDIQADPQTIWEREWGGE